MITNWEELGDHLAEVENRISTLENSQGVYREEPKEPQEIVHRYVYEHEVKKEAQQVYE